jgi:stalled ribosome rescue protein Dom34
VTGWRLAIPERPSRRGAISPYAPQTMTAPTRAAVWLDHHEARIFHVDLAGFDEQQLRAPMHHFHRHPKGSSEPHTHPDDEHRFFADVAKALAKAEEILVLGPSTAKTEFLHYVQQHVPGLTGKIAGVETDDHPTDPQIVAHVRGHFRIPPPRVR